MELMYNDTVTTTTIKYNILYNSSGIPAKLGNLAVHNNFIGIFCVRERERACESV